MKTVVTIYLQKRYGEWRATVKTEDLKESFVAVGREPRGYRRAKDALARSQEVCALLGWTQTHSARIMAEVPKKVRKDG